MSKAAPAKTASTAVAPVAHAREKNIELALSSITKQFGDGSIMRLGSNAKMKVETLSTGSLAVDLALGVDEGIALQRKLVNRFAEDTGLTNGGRRVTYEFLLSVQNNKKTAERVVLHDQLPLSRNEKIVVKHLSPDPKDL
eukprot:gene17616-biopygen14861